MALDTGRGWTYWKGYHDATFVAFTLLRWDRSSGRTEQWTGSEWVAVPGLGLIHAVLSGDLGHDEITPEEAAAIVGSFWYVPLALRLPGSRQLPQLAPDPCMSTFTVASNEFIGGGKEKAEYHVNE